MKKLLCGLLSGALMMSAMPAAAAVAWQVDKNGKLIGATGVVIDKSTYTVTFADGTCTAIYGACAANKFDFRTQAAALAAGNALLSQVLTGIYKTNPGLVFGCSTSMCDSFIPYTMYPDEPGSAQAIVVGNRGSTNRFVNGDVYPGANDSTVADPNVNYARFTLQVAAIPEPAT